MLKEEGWVEIDVWVFSYDRCHLPKYAMTFVLFLIFSIILYVKNFVLRPIILNFGSQNLKLKTVYR